MPTATMIPTTPITAPIASQLIDGPPLELELESVLVSCSSVGEDGEFCEVCNGVLSADLVVFDPVCVEPEPLAVRVAKQFRQPDQQNTDYPLLTRYGNWCTNTPHGRLLQVQITIRAPQCTRSSLRSVDIRPNTTLNCVVHPHRTRTVPTHTRCLGIIIAPKTRNEQRRLPLHAVSYGECRLRVKGNILEYRLVLS